MSEALPTVTRFAPSPTGYLHLGHAYSALFAAEAARLAGGRFLLRIEDIDTGRCRSHFEAAIFEDLAWLGLAWEEPVRRQSDYMDDYAAALDSLLTRGLLYPCFCTRKDIRAEIAAAGHAPHAPPPEGPDGPLYPGTCRRFDATERQRRMAAGRPFALRLDVARATGEAGPLTWTDAETGPAVAEPGMFGDVVLARKDTPSSYHLAVSLDDHLQGVTLVTRGEVLYHATHVHRLLQALLGLSVPAYRHHGLLTDKTGKRLAKRDEARTVRSLRDEGMSAEAVRGMALEGAAARRVP